MTSPRPLAVVTGASSGFGIEFAKRLAADGYDLVTIARDRRSLERAARPLRELGVSVTVLPADLSDAKTVDRVGARLAARPVEVLINNAGFGGYGSFDRRPLADDRAMVRVNAEALISLTRLLLPGMLRRKRGRILNLASTAAFLPGPQQAVYFATKAFVLSFSNALSVELHGRGVTVTALCPGPSQTNFGRAGGLDRTPLFSGRLLDPATVARIGYRGMLRGKPIVIPGLRSKLTAWVSRVLPRLTAAELIAQAQRTR